MKSKIISVLILSVALLPGALSPTRSALAFSTDLFTHHQTAPIKKSGNPLIKKVAVLGRDDRIKLPARHVPLASGIGILGQPGRRGWSCTAFCVAPDIIATNAHCIVKNPTVGRRLNLARTLFVLPAIKAHPETGQKNDRVTHPRYVDPKNPSLSVFSGQFFSTRSVNAQSEDWAFTKLRRNICEGRSLNFDQLSLSTIFEAARAKKLFMIGFHGDKKMSERLYSDKCRVRSPNDRKYFLSAQRRQMSRRALLLPHTCDAFKGSSGSPILISTPKGVRVVGINLGSLRYERYQIKKNRYTGKVISRKKLRSGKETNMAVRPLAFLDGLNRYKQETLLSSNSQIREMQTHLKTLRFYRGRIDGKWGRRSQRALRAFEKKRKLAPLGLPTREVLEMLANETRTLNQS